MELMGSKLNRFIKSLFAEHAIKNERVYGYNVLIINSN